MTFSAADHGYMAQALRLAERGLYITTPNPRVGCVIVADKDIIGTGFTQPAGHNHAETEALNAARANHASRLKGATVYVTLEPCSHVGLTAPCINALIEAGVGKVVASMQDPNPKVSGNGFSALIAAGISVETGLLEAAAHELNIGFVSRMTRGRPWVRLKVAASLDGKTALQNGKSQWITGVDARRDGHRFRARSCAILTGAGTVRADNPQLSVRDIETTRQPLRVIVDSHLEVPVEAQVFSGGNTLIACAIDDHEKIMTLKKTGAEIIVLPNPDGKVDLKRLLEELARRGVNELHVEAGAKLNGSLIREELVDELLVYLAPSLLGEHAQGMFGFPALSELSAKHELKVHDLRQVGSDIRIQARFISQG